MKLRHWTTGSLAVLLGAFIISSAQADTLTNVFSGTITLNGLIDSFFDGSGNPLPGVFVKVDPVALNAEAPVSASSTLAPQAYHPSAFNQARIMSAYNPFVNGGTIYIGVDLPGGDGTAANPNYSDSKGPTRGTAGPGGVPAIVPFDADGNGLAQSIGTNTVGGTDMKRCMDMGTPDVIDCGLQINAGFTDDAADAAVNEHYSANVTFGDGTFVTVNLFESQSTGEGLARLEQCGGCPPSIADETPAATFGAVTSTSTGGASNGSPLGLDVEFAITNVNANVDACNRLIQTVTVNSGSNSDGNDNGEDSNMLMVNYVLPATLSCDVLFFTNQTTRITTNACGTDAPVGVTLGDQVTISVVVRAAQTNAQNISSYTVMIPDVGTITVNSPLAPGQSATNVVGTFTCEVPGVNTFQASVSGVGAITSDCFPIQTACSTSLQCCGTPCVNIIKSIACFPAQGTCASISPSSYAKTATGYKTDAGNPAFCYRVTVTNCGDVALQNVVVVDSQQGTLTFATSLAVGSSATTYYSATYSTNTMNTVKVDADGVFSSGHVMGSDNANAVVIPANITCSVSLSSPDDQDGNASDNHVSLPNDGSMHNVTFSVSVSAGNASLVAVTLTSAELSALNCTLPAPFSLAANHTTNITLCTEGILCQQSGSINVHVQGNIDESGGVCARTSEPFLLYVQSDCSGSIDCLACPTCTIDGPTAACAGTKNLMFTVTPSLTSTINWSITGNGTITSGTNGTSVTADAGAAGTFTLTAKVSANGCTNSCQWTVTVNAPPTVSVNSPKVCLNNPATITATASGAPTLQYKWTVPGGASDPGNVSSFNATVAGQYCVLVTDGNGCTNSACGSVTIYNPPTVSVNSATNCSGKSATIIATASGAPTLQYKWTVPGGASDPGNVSSFSASVAGQYCVLVTDGNGCTNSACGNLVLNQGPSVSVNSATNCTGKSSTIIATASGAPTLQYKWTVPGGASDPGNVSSFSASVAGQYCVLVTDGNGCTNSACGNLVLNQGPSVSVNSATNCVGGSSTIIATASGAPTLQYKWTVPGGASDPGNVSSFSASVAGQYCVLVTDGNGCTNSACGNLVLNPKPSVSVNSATNCTGKSSTIIATASGAPTLQYKWTVPGGASDPGNVSSFSASVAGQYCVLVTDGNGCTNSACGNLVLNQGPSVSVNSATNCAGKSSTIIATASGAPTLQYKWTVPGGASDPGNVSSFSASVAGQYCVLVTDGNGCTNSACGNLVLNQGPSVSVSSATNCAGKSSTIIATASGAPTLHYAWVVPNGASDPGDVASFNASVAGSYCVVVTDGNGCTNRACGALVLNQPPSVSVNSPSVCAGSATITATPSGNGPFSYAWTVPVGASDPGSVASFSATVVGQYCVVVTDQNGCTNGSCGNLSLSTPPDCKICMKPVFEWGWKKSRHSWDGWSSKNCIVGPPKCQGSKVQLCGPAGMCSYLWNGPEQDGATTQCITVSTEGTYTLTIADCSGCSNTCDIVIHSPPPCLISGNTTICQGGQTTLCGPDKAGLTYLWNGPEDDGSTSPCITVGTPGKYTLTVSDSFGGHTTCSTYVCVKPPPTCSICIKPGWGWDAADSKKTGIRRTWYANSSSGCIVGPPKCQSTKVQLCGPSGMCSYRWDGPEQSGSQSQCITVSTQGTYHLYIADCNGCTNSCEVTVHTPPPCTITGKLNICKDGSTTLCGPDGLSYQWSGPEQSGSQSQCLTVSTPGTYYLTVSDDFGSSTCSVTVCVTAPPSYICMTTAPQCYGGKSWSCSSSDNGLKGSSYCKGTKIQLCGPSGPYSCKWSGPEQSGSTSSCIIVSTPGTYKLCVTDSNGCSSTCTLNVTCSQY